MRGDVRLGALRERHRHNMGDHRPLALLALRRQGIDARAPLTGGHRKVVGPPWTTATETASRVRGRIEMVLDWATVSELHSGENPACWCGHLQHKLPRIFWLVLGSRWRNPAMR